MIAYTVEMIVERGPEMGIHDLTTEGLHCAFERGDLTCAPFPEGFAVLSEAKRLYGSARLYMLYVEPNFRGRGVGTRMLRDIEAKFSPELDIEIDCRRFEREPWFVKRGYRTAERTKDNLLMRWHVRATGNRESARIKMLVEIYQRLRDYAARHPSDKLEAIVSDLQIFILMSNLTARSKRAANLGNAAQDRNPVSTEEIVKFRDEYPHRNAAGQPKRGWQKAMQSHFEQLGRSIDRATINRRRKKAGQE